jgi:hypothetical protein
VYVLVGAAHLAGGLNGKLWLDSALAAVGTGKGGGKPEQAMGNLPGGESELSTLLAAAKSYVASL